MNKLEIILSILAIIFSIGFIIFAIYQFKIGKFSWGLLGCLVGLHGITLGIGLIVKVVMKI